ncbi:bis(monoacylglycero)phosphate synthase CLN5-like [Haliotis cracherodii]|uniref:bis(monoacylglycero)phosphate synthase CLN5-like n=1 Tax=Haliotis cracherodii TaxID=6455 RepID=UPI0039EA38F9
MRNAPLPDRPDPDPRCYVGDRPFCAGGTAGIPTFSETDEVEIYHSDSELLPSPMARNMTHASLYIRNLNTGKNYTLEWYSFFKLANCIKPKVLDDDSLLWCNQGGSCFMDYVVPRLKTGERFLVATTSGATFNSFADWVRRDNNTQVTGQGFYIATSPGGQLWFEANDCGTFAIRAYDALSDLGVKFYQARQPHYSRGYISAKQPTFLGSVTDIFGPTGNHTLARNLVQYYKEDDRKEQEMEYGYMYFNEAYWNYTKTSTSIIITNVLVPLPGGQP